MFKTQYTKYGVRAVWMAMLPPPPTKPACVVLGGRKEEEYSKPRTIGRRVSYGKIELTTVAVAQDIPSGMQLDF